MTIEDELRNFILKRYRSLREFTIEAGMSYSTVTSILTRGIDSASLSNMMKICNVLKISIDELAEGRITPTSLHVSVHEGLTDIDDIIDDVENELSHINVTIGGKEANKETIASIIHAMRVGAELAKVRKS